MEDASIYDTDVFHVIGLLEELESLGGKSDLNTITSRTNMEYGDLQKIVKVSEKLGVVNTPGSDIELTESGKKIAVSNIHSRKEIFRNLLANTDIFKHLIAYIDTQPSKSITMEELENYVKTHIPRAELQQVIKGLLNYATFANLLRLNRRTNTISIPKPKIKS